MTGRKSAAGEKLRGEWLQDAEGRASDDPAVLKSGGTLLPAGGLDHGHKGYGMALLVESLSQGLTGYGRGNAEKRWGAATYVQVMQPELFAGLAAFNERTSAIAALVHGSRPHPDHAAVRLPGENALRRKRDALANGVVLFPGLMDKLREHAARLGVAAPT
jgi:LDH2 family malate/lactate/ureidoglycolate dehydrogenase